MDEAVDILGLTVDEFVAAAAARGTRRPRALELYRAAFREGKALEPWVRIGVAPVAATQVDGETVKFTQRYADGLETESVLIPMWIRGERRTARTLCVSSQVGCAMGCRFCETAQMGLLKHLSAADIVGQWFAATHLVGHRPRNIVFMGMGEPMDNLDEVLQAIRVLAGHDGPALPPAHVAVSTVGRPEGIARLAEFAREPGFRRVNLAVSLNAPNDAVRESIMPINRACDMARLREAMLAFPNRPTVAICVEYVLIPGVNDAPEHCDELCDYLKPVRCSLNVIPYNPRRDSPWRAPTEDEIAAFIDRARDRGQFVKRRHTKGRGVMGACGQLGNEHIRGRRDVRTGERVRISVRGERAGGEA
jgi:23S rRNA (adenine2503-C2)-methyltransferase